MGNRDRGEFVRKVLTPLVAQKAGGSVERLEYEVLQHSCHDPISECVVIRHKRGYIQRVIVSGLDDAQLITAVTKAVS